MGARSAKLTAEQITLIERRRKSLGLTREKFLAKFTSSLNAVTGIATSASTVKMRLDRALNAKMSCPVSDTTKVALARALDWSVNEFERVIGVNATHPIQTDGPVTMAPRTARQIAHCVSVQLDTHQITRGVDLSVDNLENVYAATYRMFQHIRELMEELPVDDFERDPAAQEIYDTLASVLNEGLRPHLSTWREQYAEWLRRFCSSPRAKKMAPQQLQTAFPRRAGLERDLANTAQQLRRSAKKLRQLARRSAAELSR